ncbi:MAG: MBL fold metallo-hydrolase [Bacteroidetes bacterium QH_9_67_14]|nr:MAG: MBL fold metallo-hydrolase [Bacteroidetes bacterium QH_9_67_14]
MVAGGGWTSRGEPHGLRAGSVCTLSPFSFPPRRSDMLLETVKSEGLAHLSYVLGDPRAGACVVIDPRRDVDAYLDIAHRRQVQITHVIETHVHADFVSGSRALAARTGAPVYGGAAADYAFDVEPLEDGDELTVGSLALEVVHTPGHSPEHLALVASGGGAGAEDRWGVFTGDALFAGEVGRPDLADTAPEEQAHRLYHSLNDKLLALDDGLTVYPAHGKGSPCGGNIGARDQTTIGYERRHNDALQAESAEAFAEHVLGGLEHEPFYYRRLKKGNARGLDALDDPSPPPALTADAFNAERQNEETLVVDTREIDAFAGAHIEGALSLPLRKSFPVWAGWMLRPEQRLLLVTGGPSDAATAQRHLWRTGFDRVAGFLQNGMRNWTESGRSFDRLGALGVHELKARIEDDAPLHVLDVRSEAEWERGRIPTARHAWTPFLPEHLDGLDREQPVAVYCGSGYRASIAASVLRRTGFERVANVPGSMGAWKAAGYDLEG